MPGTSLKCWNVRPMKRRAISNGIDPTIGSREMRYRGGTSSAQRDQLKIVPARTVRPDEPGHLAGFDGEDRLLTATVHRRSCAPTPSMSGPVRARGPRRSGRVGQNGAWTGCAEKGNPRPHPSRARCRARHQDDEHDTRSCRSCKDAGRTSCRLLGHVISVAPTTAPHTLPAQPTTAMKSIDARD